LIWRAAAGDVEQLPPTGPVLGGFIEGAIEQATVKLTNGDVFALFTDGMTEVGPSRKEFLEVEGLMPLFVRCCAGADAEAIKDCLVEAVETYAGGAAGLRDDIALLVGVVRGVGGRQRTETDGTGQGTGI
jgi:serine phosphatase RsbU (regulator of sigma subunit)